MLVIKDIWVVHQGDTDRTVGYPKWYFDNKEQADNTANKRGWYGGTAPTYNKKAIVQNGQYYIIEKQISEIEINKGPVEIEEVKVNALNKLTPFERQVLGL